MAASEEACAGVDAAATPSTEEQQQKENDKDSTVLKSCSKQSSAGVVSQ